MLYRVRYQLVSWTGSSEHLVELSNKEANELEKFLEKERLENRLYGYHISEALIRNLWGVSEVYKRDLKIEKEMAEEK